MPRQERLELGFWKAGVHVFPRQETPFGMQLWCGHGTKPFRDGPKNLRRQENAGQGLLGAWRQGSKAAWWELGAPTGADQGCPK